MNKLWHTLAGKNTCALAFGGLALQALPQTSHAWEPRQDISSLVMGFGAEPRPKNGFSVIRLFDIHRSPPMTANSSPVS